MKKIFYLSVILFTAFAFQGKGQSFSLQNLNNYLQGDGITEMVGTVDVFNNTATDKNVIMFRKINILAPLHESSFCWDLCYGPTVDTCGTSVLIPAGTSVANAIADLQPNGGYGISRVTYCWYDVNNNADSVCLEFYYDATLGINGVSNSKPDFLSIPHPNPADANTVIAYHLSKANADSKIVLYNVIGSKMQEIKLNTSESHIQLNTSVFKPGVYYYSLVSGNKAISTSKLVVSHKN
jgi:hypothetical protein